MPFNYPFTIWQEGDVAFLRKDYTDIHPKATGHPCIILKKLPGDRFVVTTVSAFLNRNDRYNNTPLAPWKVQQWSNQKHFFRSFVGSELSRPNLQPLRLVPGQAWPKPKASWLMVNHVYDVPLFAICPFKSHDGLRQMAPDSLADLRMDIATNSPHYDPLWGLVDALPPPTTNNSPATPGSTKGQQRPMSEAPVSPSSSCGRPAGNPPHVKALTWAQRVGIASPPSTPRIQYTTSKPVSLTQAAIPPLVQNQPTTPKLAPSTQVAAPSKPRRKLTIPAKPASPIPARQVTVAIPDARLLDLRTGRELGSTADSATTNKPVPQTTTSGPAGNLARRWASVASLTSSHSPIPPLFKTSA